MLLGPLLRFLVHPLDVGLELVAVDAPDAAASHLDRRELAGADERVSLRNTDGQISRHIFQGEEAGLYRRALTARDLVAHLRKIAGGADGYLDLTLFALVCRRTIGAM